MTQVGNGLPLINPPPKPDDLRGMHPPRIDHVFLMCEDVDGVTAFFTDVLEFRMTEQIVADDGYQLATFLERSHTAHDLAFVTGPDGAFHHLAYWVDEWTDLRDAADICAYHGVPIDAGPTRHGATRGCGLYFFDPAGNRNEMYTGGYWFDPDDEPTTWTEAEIGTGHLLLHRPGRPPVHDGALVTDTPRPPTERVDAPLYLARHREREAAERSGNGDGGEPVDGTSRCTCAASAIASRTPRRLPPRRCGSAPRCPSSRRSRRTTATRRSPRRRRRDAPCSATPTSSATARRRATRPTPA